MPTHLVVNWENDGADIRRCIDSDPKKQVGGRIVAYNKYFQNCISWGDISTGAIAVKKVEEGFLFDSVGISLFDLGENESYFLALLNSKPAMYFLSVLCPTIHFNPGGVGKLPIILIENDRVKDLVKLNISIAKKDWNSRETSWDFQLNPLLANCEKSLKECVFKWTKEVTKEFIQIHKHEEELNKIFIDIYNLKNKLEPDVPLEDVSILQEEIYYDKLAGFNLYSNEHLLPIRKDVPIQNLISYSISCFMGRYRLDKPGLQIAYPHPVADELAAYTYTSPATGKVHQIEIDEDAIIPMMGSKSNFSDDVIHRLRQFLVAVWGEDMLTQNINFIQECLNQDVEDYLVKKFWNYQVRTYSKRPIYWLFSSKKGTFQALVYMHRMNRFTVEKLRDKYLLKHILFLEQERDRLKANSATLSKVDQKKLDAIIKDLQECEDYDLLLKDVATRQIVFDLDDGVTRNYELFKGVVAPIK